MSAYGGNSGLMMPHVGVNDIGVADFVISFEANSTAVDSASVRGMNVASVVRDGAGEHTVTLNRDVYKVVAAMAQPAGVSGGDKAMAQVFFNGTDGELTSPLTFKVYTYANGAAATALSDLANGRRIYVRLACRLSPGA